MQMRNNNGPRTDLWSTPDTVSLIVETWTVVLPLGMSRTNAPKFNDPKFIAPKLNVPNPPKLNALNLMFGT